MKKSLFYSTAVLSALAMASCSKDNVTNVTPSENNGASQVIEIAVDNGGDGLTTRAGRPLFSSEAKQTIENVKIIVCDNSNNVVADTLITNWTSSSEEYDDASGHGRKVRFTIGGSNTELSKNTGYTAYAFGYHTGSQYQANNEGLDVYLAKVGNGKKWDNGASVDNSSETVKSFNPNLTITNNNSSKTTKNAEEIFAGSTTISVDKNGNFSQGMTLHRQVAGIYTYVKNIPYYAGARYLKLYAVKEEPKMVLGKFYNAILGENGTSDNTQMNVVNGTGSSSATETLVAQIDLHQWFNNGQASPTGVIQDVNNDGIIDRYEYKKSGDGTTLEEDTEKPIWRNPISSESNKVYFVKGSVFAGEFIIPFQKGESQTFYLALTDGGTGSEKVYRRWNINLPVDDVLSSESLWTWSSTSSSWSEQTSISESKDKYSVLRNHLYSVGTKSAENPDNGGTDPENPTTDKEDPEDLATRQDLMLQVNDNWELIHSMEID